MIVRGASLQPRPWPNGHGITRDVHGRHRPDGAFDWLISIADLAGSAPFSHFPGVDRVFTLIEGDAVTLIVDGTPLPCRTWLPASFPGDRPTLCEMSSAPARAFNLFVDRARCRGHVAVRMIAAGHVVAAPATTVAVHCASGRLAAAGEWLDAGDTLLTDETPRIVAGPDAAVAVIVWIDDFAG